MNDTRESIAAISYVDADGVLRWKSNNRVPFGDILSIYFGGDIDSIVKSNAARDADTEAFLAEYRKNDRGPSAEERAEARAAHGPGVELVNVITGRKWRT